MKPLFTIHAGEFLVASYIEQQFRNYLVWLPSRDSGIDLLLTDHDCTAAVSIQVKFSRDFLATHMSDALRPGLKACGWFTLKRQKIVHSTAKFWIFVLYPFNQREVDFVIMPPSAILDMLIAVHGQRSAFQSYLWVTKDKRCWEARGLSRQEQLLVSKASYQNAARELTTYLNNWNPIHAALKPNQTLQP